MTVSRARTEEFDTPLDTVDVENPDGSQVRRDGVFIGDPFNVEARARVQLLFGVHGVSVFGLYDSQILELLAGIVAELGVITQHLATITDEEFDGRNQGP